MAHGDEPWVDGQQKIRLASPSGAASGARGSSYPCRRSDIAPLGLSAKHGTFLFPRLDAVGQKTAPASRAKTAVHPPWPPKNWGHAQEDQSGSSGGGYRQQSRIAGRYRKWTYASPDNHPRPSADGSATPHSRRGALPPCAARMGGKIQGEIKNAGYSHDVVENTRTRNAIVYFPNQ